MMNGLPTNGCESSWPRGGIEVIGVASSVQEAQAILDTQRPDVVFLDVEMPGASGLQLLPSVPRSTQVVFVTAHETYAARMPLQPAPSTIS